VKKYIGIVFRVLGYVVLAVIVLVAAALLTLPWTGPRLANKKLPELLRTEASLGSLKLNPLRGRLALGALTIGQPEGFGEGVLLSLPALNVRVDPASLVSSPLVVEEVALDGLEVNIIRNADGVLNTDALGPRKEAQAEPSPAPAPSPAAEAGEEKPAQPVLVKRVAITNLSFSYTDQAIGKEAAAGAAAPNAQAAPAPEKILTVRVKDFNLLLENLLIDPAADPKAIAPAALSITARLIQEELGDGHLGLSARIGPIGKGIPALNGALRLIGLELGPLDAVIPAGTTTALGGDALDIIADFSVATDLLDCQAAIETNGGKSYSLPVTGTPDKPQFDTSSILFVVLSRFGGGVGALAGNIAGAGTAVVGATAETALAVGEGAVGVVGSIGGGLFDTVASVATGDLEGAGEGLTKATIGSAGEVVDTVGTAGGRMAEGAGEAVAAGLGDARAQEWRAGVKDRWAAEWQKAQDGVAAKPFPPVAKAEPSPAAAAGESK
jgi:hypothetical protein